jgi:hypothetical protein
MSKEITEAQEQHLPMRLPKNAGSPLYENIVECEERVLTSQRRVRVWFQRTAEGPESIKDWVALQEYVHSHRKDETDPLSYAVALATELPRVNAVQVSDGDHGSIYYPN